MPLLQAASVIVNYFLCISHHSDFSFNPCKLVYIPSTMFEVFIFSVFLITKVKGVKEITLVGLAVSSVVN